MSTRASLRTGLVLVAAFSWSAAAAQPTRTFQMGLSGGASAETASCTVRPDGGNGTATEGSTLTLGDARGLVAFPRIIGSLADQVPAGAVVTGATLELHVLAVPGSAVTRQLQAHPLFDVSGEGPWQEPLSPALQAPAVGVDWLHRDGRPGIADPWLIPGGDILFAPPPVSAEATVGQGAGVWVSLDVTAVVGFLAQGYANLGWALIVDQSGDDLVLAADDHPDPALRPRLTVSWSTVAAPFNHVPQLADHQLTLTQGASAILQLPLVDQDGEGITYVLRERPVHGDVVGGPWFSYTPRPEFTGADRFTLFAHDGFASSPVGTVSITVNVDPSASQATLQAGVGVGLDARSASMNVSLDPANQVSAAGPELVVAGSAGAAVLDFPSLIASGGASQVPPGATVLRASLEVHVTQVDGAASGRILTAHRLLDPARLGPWQVPGSASSTPDSGVSWLFRDATPGVRTPWLVPGGERDQATSASASVDAGASGTWLIWDVTAAVQSWSEGGRNLGWMITNSSADGVRMASVSYADPALRPRLFVIWRAAAGGANLPPVAQAGPDGTATANELVTLDGSASYDPEGQSLSIWWLQTQGPPVGGFDPSESVVSFSAPSVASPVALEFVLIASDGTATAFDAVRINVGSAAGSNAPPFVDAGADEAVNEGGSVVLDEVTVIDPEGAALTTSWTQVVGTAAPLQSIPFTPHIRVTAPFISPAQSPMPLVFRLEASDGVHVVHDYVTVTVTDVPNAPPVADAGPAQVREGGAWAGLDGRASTDPDPGTELYHHWNQIQGPPVVLYQTYRAVPYFQCPSVNSTTDLVFRLTVSDGEFQDADTTTVTVEPRATEFQGNPQSLAAYTHALSPREAAHFLRRAGYGGPESDVAQMMAQGLATTVSQMMSPQTVPAVEQAAWAHVPTPVTGDIYPQANQVQVGLWWLTYALRSPMRNQLREKLAYFFHDRYAASLDVTGAQERHWAMEHLDEFRQDPLPNYRLFLLKLTRNNLMLDFLDGHDNQVGSPNENYAREFWELFTMGVFDPNTGLPNYTEFDIQEAARAFTGWEVYDPPGNPSDSYYSRFNPARFDPGVKNVLGQSGPWNDLDVIDITLARPQSADYICRMLFEFFVHDQPGPALLQSLAQTLTAANWNLAPVVETILKSEAMFSADALKNRVKTPTEFAVGFIRQTGLTVPETTVHSAMVELGHEPGRPPTVKGWAEGSFWLGEAASAYRSQIINDVVAGRIFQSGVSLDPLMPPPGLRSAGATVARVLEVLGVELQTVEQFHTLVEYMNTRVTPAGNEVVLFDGALAADQSSKLRGLLFIVAFGNPAYHVN